MFYNFVLSLQNSIIMEVQIKDNKIYAPLKDKWLVLTPEERVRQEYICRLVNHYGFDLSQMAQEIQVNNSQRGQGKARADIVIWKSKQDKIESKAAFIVVECKAENVRIREEDYYQGYNYASWAGASFFVTTNEKETKYFNVDKEYLPKELVEVVAIPTAEEALNDKKDVKTLDLTKELGVDVPQACIYVNPNSEKQNDIDNLLKLIESNIKFSSTEMNSSKLLLYKQRLIRETPIIYYQERFP